MIKSKKLSKIKDLQHGFFNSIGGKSKNIKGKIVSAPIPDEIKKVFNNFLSD